MAVDLTKVDNNKSYNNICLLLSNIIESQKQLKSASNLILAVTSHKLKI
jgi:hypothetical protein